MYWCSHDADGIFSFCLFFRYLGKEAENDDKLSGIFLQRSDGKWEVRGKYVRSSRLRKKKIQTSGRLKLGDVGLFFAIMPLFPPPL